MFSDILRAEISCHLIAFCSRLSNMGFFSVFQGRKRQWHRRSNGRGSGALFGLLSHRQVSIVLLKFTGLNSGNCFVSLLKVFSCLASICWQWKCALFWRWRGGILQIAQQLLSNWQHKLFPTAKKGNSLSFTDGERNSEELSLNWEKMIKSGTFGVCSGLLPNCHNQV